MKPKKKTGVISWRMYSVIVAAVLILGIIVHAPTQQRDYPSETHGCMKIRESYLEVELFIFPCITDESTLLCINARTDRYKVL